MVRLRLMTLLMAAIVVVCGSLATAEKVEIEFQYRHSDVAEHWIREFEELHPEIKVNFLLAPSGWSENTLVRWATGDGPDVVEVYGDFGQNWARSGALLDLRPYVARDFDQDEIEDFWPMVWEAAFILHGEYAGIQFKLPRYTPASVCFYNVDHIQDAGLVEPLILDRDQQRWTYEMLREMAKKLTIFDGDEVARPGFATSANDYRRLSTWVRAFGGEWFNPKDPTDFMGDDPRTIEAMTFLQEMIWSDRSTLPRADRNRFAAGEVPMMEQILNSVATFQAAGDYLNWGVVPMPVGPNGRKTRTGDDGIAVWANSKHPEAAWEFAKFVTSTRGQEIQVIHYGHPPVRKSAVPFFLEYYPGIDPWVVHTALMDAGFEVAGMMAGDVGQIVSLLKQALTDSLVQNNRPYSVAIKEVVEPIEALARAGVSQN